eukprot:CAMPEP_0204499880 /NCGR_PEP_ID=MMETSP0471-20130131/95976_1 /ASSEMBLY_ACC=CAM_ASM_000602 /TAXON_ID=2969 /ORGANISM="Oxyrrhis marina" /LENGTH=32 /DNA_ID= /DNA_START= /DNA_END= /DNA_ORIENTATION=
MKKGDRSSAWLSSLARFLRANGEAPATSRPVS